MKNFLKSLLILSAIALAITFIDQHVLLLSQNLEPNYNRLFLVLFCLSLYNIKKLNSYKKVYHSKDYKEIYSKAKDQGLHKDENFSNLLSPYFIDRNLLYSATIISFVSLFYIEKFTHYPNVAFFFTMVVLVINLYIIKSFKNIKKI